MRASVKAAIVDYNTPLEGCFQNPYPDCRNLITVAIGCLLDTGNPAWSLATCLKWYLPDGSLATAEQVRAQLTALKASNLKAYSAGSKTIQRATTIRLTAQGVLDITDSRAQTFEARIKTYLPNWDHLPADAQMACLGMAWALGGDFLHEFGNFQAAVLAQDYIGASAACGIRTDNNPGIVPRNAHNRVCLANAAEAIRLDLDPETLYWPGTTPAASDAHQALVTQAAELTDAHAARLAAGLMAGLDLSHGVE